MLRPYINSVCRTVLQSEPPPLWDKRDRSGKPKLIDGNNLLSGDRSTIPL
jgi:hypothetical protein